MGRRWHPLEVMFVKKILLNTRITCGTSHTRILRLSLGIFTQWRNMGLQPRMVGLLLHVSPIAIDILMPVDCTVSVKRGFLSSLEPKEQVRYVLSNRNALPI